MSDLAITESNKNIISAISLANHKLYILGHKLRAIGALLERQSAASDGFVELEGLGFVLNELGVEAHELARGLDTANFVGRKAVRLK